MDLPEFIPASAPISSERAQLRRQEVGRDIVSAAHRRGAFVLTSGQRSDYFFDKYLFETRPTILRRLASMLAEHVPPGVDRVAGAELGAVPLAVAVSIESGLPFVIVRKDRRHGTGRPIDGEIHPGERVILIEDVVRTGGRAVRAAAVVGSSGAEVAGVVAVVDLEQGGASRLAEVGYHYHPLFRLSELDV